jgi:hypothetical protein
MSEDFNLNEASLMMKKVSSRKLLNTRPFWALRDNRAEAEQEKRTTEKYKQEMELIRVKREAKVAFERVLSSGSYPSLQWLLARWDFVSGRATEKLNSAPKKRP